MRRREFIASTLGLAASCATKKPDPFLETLTAVWESGIPKWLGEAKMPAVSIAIIREGQLAWQRAFGVKDAGSNEPVDNDSLFAACSDTKPVFAYGVMKLVEKSVLQLDMPLTKYTARRVTKDPRVELITARHVLNHTTGFPNWRQGPELPIEFTPGTRRQYSGEGFSYLQSVVEELTHKSFDDFMRQDVLTPLGMTSSRISADLDFAKVAKPHDQKGQRLPGKYYTKPSVQEAAEGIARYGAAAMLMTTAGEYAKFLLEYLSPKPADEFRLNEASRAEMLRPQVKTNEGWAGLGWALEEHSGVPILFAHSGQDAGYYCFATACMERRSGLMVMMNGDGYVPFLLKLLADPAGPPAKIETIWPEFVKRFFAV